MVEAKKNLKSAQIRRAKKLSPLEKKDQKLKYL